jgi:UDP-N-acetyl-D-glucosamine dehydrogenase
MVTVTANVALTLEERVLDTTAKVAVMGMGYVGLPLALALVERGLDVYTVDISGEKVRAVNAGRSYIRDIPAHDVQACLATGRLHATTDDSVIANADVIFVCVPTPFTPQKEPDTSYIRDAARQIGAHLRVGQLIILRSTSYPGTTEEIVRPILEETGLEVGRDIFLAFAPERIDPGNTRVTVDQVPIVVGGCDPASTALAERFLRRLTQQVIPVSSPAAAEMAKLLENVFRNVNIALVNQVAQLCDRMSLDVWEITRAAATKPYGFMAFSPGLVGGHCIPVDPYYLAWKAREYDFHMDFIELAARVNEEMPFYIVNRLAAVLHDVSPHSGHERILVLGVAFKKDVDDARCSPALKVIELLSRRRMDVAFHDPYVTEIRTNGDLLRSQPLTRELIKSADCVLILTDHSCFDYDAIVGSASLVFDARNATKHVALEREKIVRL